MERTGLRSVERRIMRLVEAGVDVAEGGIARGDWSATRSEFGVRRPGRRTRSVQALGRLGPRRPRLSWGADGHETT